MHNLILTDNNNMKMKIGLLLTTIRKKSIISLALELPINFLYIDYHLGSAGPLYNY